MNGSKPFDVHVAGKRYGSWWEIDGKDLLISGAYGSKRTPLRGREPEKVAAKLLLDILKERKP